MAGSVVPGLKHAKNTEPDTGEKIPGPDQNQAQHAKTDDAKKIEIPRIWRNLRTLREIPDPKKSSGKFRSSENRRHDGRKTQRGKQKILEIAEFLHAEVDPVLQSEVEQFKKPPAGHRNQKHQCIGFWVSGQERVSFPHKNQPVYRQAVTQPHGEKPPMGSQSRKRPVQGPENRNQHKAQPAMPGA